MKPGRKLDSLIATKVMGFHSVGFHDGAGGPSGPWVYKGPAQSPYRRLPYYSTRIEDAWEIVEIMNMRGWKLELVYSEYFDENTGGADVTFVCKSQARGKFSTSNETIPYAICLAALKAMGVNYEE